MNQKNADSYRKEKKMGKIKANEPKKFTLTDKEFEYVKTLATLMTYTTGRDQMVSGILHLIASLRLGYKEDQDLQFEVDLQSDSHELTITIVQS